MKYAVVDDTEKFAFREGELRVRGNPVIRVTHAGVCGTDMSSWREGAHYKGLILGHEYAGIIEEPGDSGLFRRGDRVAGYTQNVFQEPCGHCEFCLRGDFASCDNRTVKTWKGGDLTHPGAYSEYTTWFPRSIYKLPDSIGLDEAALIEPFTVGLHAVSLADIQKGDKVLVLGGGIIGLTVAEWVRGYGVSEVTVTEMNTEKAAIISAYGVADHVVPAGAPDLLEQLCGISGDGYDVVFDCVGYASAINAGIAALKTEFYKKFIGVGLPQDAQAINYRDLVLRQTIFRGSKGHSFQEFERTASAMASKEINVAKYISKRIRFSNLQEGFEELKAGRGLDTKAIVEMG
ncbi:Chlorophyll synthesis pathway, bchC [uncultured delta proteobacterium]|uniref:Chlorophyll synthesis pathway, bchC n=1 Tax=uncultured delta proteobacterium TaxID=34034 RepID=A0A212J921_9DELT|nr:Chlorophyll synthesis pathway, bchC [uncultured delta proteobacterium]